MTTPEGVTKGVIRKWLKDRGAWAFAPVSRGMGKHGIPDYVCCVPVEITQEMVGRVAGLFVGIEAKANGRQDEPNGGCSKNQVDNLRGIYDARGFARVVYQQSDLDNLGADIEILDLGDRL